MIELESMAVEMPEVEGHPNRAPFRGVLTVVDLASRRAPSGSKGRRVVLTRAAAEAALPSLLGMALDYAPAFDRHDQRRKVGVITSAEVVGRNLEVGGFLYAKDFPEIVEEIARAGERKADLRPRTPDPGRRTSDLTPQTSGSGLKVALAAAVDGIRELARSMRAGKIFTLRQAQGRLSRAKSARDSSTSLRAGMGHLTGTMRAETEIWTGETPTLSHKTRQGWGNRRIPTLAAEAAAGMGRPLGMSFEVSDVTVMDLRAQVWILTHVVFTGAAILRRDKAAYEGTWIELV